MTRRLSPYLDDDLEKRFDEFRNSGYPKMNRSEAALLLIKKGLAQITHGDVITTQRALHKAILAARQTTRVLQSEFDKIEFQNKRKG